MYIILVICGWVPDRRCETGFLFFLSNGTYCFPFICCAIYLLVNSDHLHFYYFFIFCIFVADDVQADFRLSTSLFVMMLKSSINK